MQGGVGAYTAALSQALITNDIQVSVVTSSGILSSSHNSTQFSLVPGENQGYYPQTYPQVARWNWRIWGEIPRLAERIRADWIHVQYQTAAYGMHPAINFAPVWWNRQGLPVAWTYHDLLVPYLFPKAGQRIRRWVTERPAFASRFTVVTNEADYRQLAARVPHVAKIPIGSNVPGQVLGSADRLARRRQRGFTGDELLVGYFGFLNHSKGGTTLIRALHRLVEDGQNAHLLMIGERVGASDPTNYAYLQRVEALIRDLGLSNRVHWTGRQPDDEVSLDLASCDVLLMPYEDGASLRRGTLMAGLANGCAIVTTTPQMPLPELVDGRDVLYVPPGDPASAAQAVKAIASDPGLARQLRSNAQERSRLFSWATIAAEHIALYRRFL